MKKNTHKKGFTLIELLVVIAIIGVLAAVILVAVNSARFKAQDSNRISEIREIAYALALYYDANGKYPTCLNVGGTCTTTLAGSIFMNKVPKDPTSGLDFSYAGIGAGANCTTYHLGTSLYDKTNRALLTGADATPQTVCTGSYADFSGLSYTAAGQLCNTTAGTPQPTGLATGETCYDVTP